MSTLSLRRYEPGDADAVRDLHVRALSAADAYDEEFSHRDADLRAIGDEYLEAGGDFLVGELAADPDGENAGPAENRANADIVAMGGFQPHEDESDAAVLRRMRVAPDHHRRGFGTSVLEALESRIADRGFDRIVLDTTPVQEAAIAFYEHHGYERFRTETVRGLEILFYEKRVDGPG